MKDTKSGRCGTVKPGNSLLLESCDVNNRLQQFDIKNIKVW
jgi:hypothetical protein